MANFLDDIAEGSGRPKLRIIGRPREGCNESYVILEEPGPPVLLHFAGRQVPHFKVDCPTCKLPDHDIPKPFRYVGAITVGSSELGILELNEKCYRGAEVASRAMLGDGGEVGFYGLMVNISRGSGKASKRILRPVHRVRKISVQWTYHTREELARIWGIPIRPRLYREGGA